jgi:hypothetical protein
LSIDFQMMIPLKGSDCRSRLFSRQAINRPRVVAQNIQGFLDPFYIFIHIFPLSLTEFF